MERETSRMEREGGREGDREREKKERGGKSERVRARAHPEMTVRQCGKATRGGRQVADKENNPVSPSFTQVKVMP